MNEAMFHGVSAALGTPYQPANVRIQGTGSGVDVFRGEAIDGLVHIATNGRRGKPNQMTAQGPTAVMRQCLIATGVPGAETADATEITNATAQLSASGVNRAGDFPNIMSGVSRILMDEAKTGSEVSFIHFAEQLPDADTMDPVSIGGFGVIDSLDAHVDGNNAAEKKLQEESKGYLPIVHYANDICLTWLMTSDAIKFNNFLRSMADLSQAGLRTLNRAIIQAIASNVTLIDNVALFHADHANLIDSGNGAPSDTTLAANRALHAAMRAPGQTTSSGTEPRIVLVPDALKVTAMKAFRTLLGDAGLVIANVEQNQLYFKDNVRVIADPELDNFSTSYWYSLVDPSVQGLRSFVYRYLRGHGPDRPLDMYIDHKRRGMVFAIDFVAGFAITKHRGIVRNNG